MMPTTTMSWGKRQKNLSHTKNPTGNETLRTSVLVIIHLGGFLSSDSFVFLRKGLTYDNCGVRNLILGEQNGLGGGRGGRNKISCSSVLCHKTLLPEESISSHHLDTHSHLCRQKADCVLIFYFLKL